MTVRRWWRALWAGVRLQRSRTRGGVFLLASIVTPVAYAVVFMLMSRQSESGPSVAAYVVIAPGLIGVWYSAIAIGAAVVGDERSSGTLELLIASPTPAVVPIVGRITGTTTISIIAIPLVLFVASLLHVDLTVTEPGLAIVALCLLGLSTIGFSMILASTFVVLRSPGVVQNLIPFPLYILSAIAFPITFLPDWAQTLSKLLPLSWIAELMRSAAGQASSEPAPIVIGATLALAATYFAVGVLLFHWIERAIRRTGRASVTQ